MFNVIRGSAGVQERNDYRISSLSLLASAKLGMVLFMTFPSEETLHPLPPSRTSLAYTGVNRHASDTRIGLMDSTVPVEAVVGV